MGYYKIPGENIAKIPDCFENSEEIVSFLESFAMVIAELRLVSEEVNSAEDKEYAAGFGMLKQIAVIVLFYRQHIEILHDLIRTIQYEEVE